MIELFVKNGRLMTLMILIIIVSGLASLHILPRSEDPDMVNRAASVITKFPGASAERVEALVTEKIEQKLRKLSEIEYLASTSRPEISVIQVKLKGEVKDSEPVFSRIRDILSDVAPHLPKEALPSSLEDERSFAYTQLVSLNWAVDEAPDMLILGRYATELKSQLRLVDNTDIVEIHGQNPEEILVELNQDFIAMAGISLAQVSQAISNADVKIPAGKLVNNYNQMQIEISGALDSLDRIRSIPIISDQNSPLLVGDVAVVKRQIQKPANDLAIVNGKPALVVGTRMVKGVRVDLWSTQVAKKVAEFESMLPQSIKLEVLFDQNSYTTTRLADLVENIVIGFAIIAVVLFISLGFRSALIVVASLPLTVLFTLSVMNYYGLPIHQMSVTGLVVALGIMVDNAIVMTDTIQQKKQQGINGLKAVLDSVRHLWLPLLGSTLTTILAFMPIVLMPGDAGEFVGGIALSVIFALIGSYIISHTIVAGLAGRFIKVNNKSGWLQNGLALPSLENLFKKTLNFTLAKPRLTISLVFILPIMGFVMAKHLDEQFFPASDRDMFQIELFLPSQASIEATKRITEQVSTELEKHHEIEKLHWFIGKSAPSFYYNLISSKDGMQNYAQAMITATDFKAANRLIPELQVILDEAFPQAQVLVRKLEQGPPFNAPIEIRIFGPNLDTLQELGSQLRLIFSQTDDIMHSRATLLPGTPKVWLQADEDTLNGLNLSLVDIAKQLEAGLDGVVQGSIIEATESINVRVKISDSEREDINVLNNFPIVNSRDGTYFPLSAISQAKINPSRGAIPHRDGMRVNVIEGYVRSGVLPSVALAEIQQKITEQNFVMPSGYSLEIGGESDARDSAVGKLLSSVGIILILLITVVVLSFNSFRVSSIIFISAFMSTGLGLFSVYVFNHPFGFTVIIGLLGLMGLAINSAIVILAELKADPAAISGDENAIINGVLSCTRHISSTTITTVGGFLPLILAGGGFWPPFAIAIAGGTVLTTLLSFYFVPAAFYLMSNKKPFEQTSPAIS
ncbi:efflux RND transporter permease subunit [Thalassotalea nanhaiensis]|uniref:Efflux RND transporter permease subunit n=1 Tax=Thalassotalea nanhaiensis TaxID=3065648 RepID=A0ABY9TMZ3_9GAMM|nr:efflux RND transporter permease subunit [Colwelliaceae bacterium SQ345]